MQKDESTSKFKPVVNRLVNLFFQNHNFPLSIKIISSPFIAFIHCIFGLLFALVQRLISPIILIRIGRIYNQRLGHFILEFDWLETTGGNSTNEQIRRFPIRFCLFFLSGKSSNMYLEKIVKKRLHILPRSFLLGVFIINRLFPDGGKYSVAFPVRQTDFRYLDNSPVNYTFTTEEQNISRAILMEIGINPDEPIVCFYIRDSAYAEKYYPEQTQDFARYRDCQVVNFEKSMEFLADKGYQVFRMGKYGAKTLTLRHPRIHDYAFSPLQSDFMDFYLSAKCEFAVATDSGAMMLPIFFRRPLLLVNIPAFHGLLSGKCLTLFQFKTFKEIQGGSELNLINLIKKGAVGFESQEEFTRAGIQHEENTSDEILNAVKEMLQLNTNGKNKQVVYDFSQDLFNYRLDSIGLIPVSGKLSSSWLRQHPNFLEG